MASLGTAFVDIKADTSGLGASLDKGVTQASRNATQSMGGLTNAVKGVGVAAVAAIGVTAAKALFELGKASVEAASNLQESVNAIDVVFGDAATSIHALGEDSAQSFGLSQRAFNEFATQFSAFAQKIAPASGQSVGAVVEEMTTRISDFASVMNLDMAEAATVFQSGLAGETEAFRRFGVDVSAAAVELKAMELGLGDTSAELTEQEKILARYELIMEQTEKTAGDFANTSDSLANQQRILAASVEDVQAKIGGLLVPAVAKGTGALADMVTILDLVLEKMDGIAGSGADGAPAVTDAMIGMVPIVGQVYQGFTNWANALGIVTDELTDNDTATAHQTVVLESGTEALAAYNDMAAEQAIIIPDGTAVLDAYNDMAVTQAGAVDRSTEAIQANVEALQTQQDKIRAQVDPLFALFEATQEQAEAQAAVNEAIATGNTESSEYTQLLADLYLANLDLKDAGAVARVATDLTKQGFIDAGIAAGGDRAQVQALADKLYELDAITIDPKHISFIISEIRRAAGPQRGGITEFAHSGGTIGAGLPLGTEVNVTALAGETIRTVEQERALGAVSANITVNVQGNLTPGMEYRIGDEIERRLQRLADQRTTR